MILVCETVNFDFVKVDNVDDVVAHLVAVPEGVGDRLQAGGVPGQLEDPHDPHDPEDGHHPPHVVEAPAPAFLVLVLGLDQEDRDKVGKDGEHVHNVHGVLEEGTLFRGTWISRFKSNLECCLVDSSTWFKLNLELALSQNLTFLLLYF